MLLKFYYQRIVKCRINKIFEKYINIRKSYSSLNFFTSQLLFTAFLFTIEIPSFAQEGLVSEDTAVKYAKSFSHIIKPYKEIADFLQAQDNKSIVSLLKTLDLNQLASVYLKMGQQRFDKTDYSAAIEFQLFALSIYQDIGNLNGYAKTCNSLARTYHYHSPITFELARDYCMKALHIEQQLDDSIGMINSYAILGDLYSDAIKEGFYNPDTARIFYSIAIKIADNFKADTLIKANLYSSMGNIYRKLQKYDNSLKLLTMALEMQQSIADTSGITFTLHRLATLYKFIGNIEQSLKHAKLSLEYAEKGKNLDLINNICENISELFYIQGDYRKAMEYYQKAVEVKFRIYSDNGIEKVAYYQAKYESERKEKEILLLKSEKELQMAAIARKETESKKQRIIIYSFIVGFVLVSILVLVVYNGYRNKIKSNRLLSLQKEEIQIKHNLLQQQKEEIESQRDEIKKQNISLDEANRLIQLKNKNITDSIKYAQRIQNALLPDIQYIQSLFAASFVLYLPQSFVSGDFYWVEQKQEYIYVAAVDCTGHGVPGALMSIIGYNILNQALNEKQLLDPNEIIGFLNQKVAETLRHSHFEYSLQDGMDLVLCRINRNDWMMTMTGIRNSMYMIRNGILNELKSVISAYDRIIGKHQSVEMQLQKGDMLYFFTDGYTDQFQENTSKKYNKKRFRQHILNLYNLPLDLQEEKLLEEFLNWKGLAEQTDDVMVLGIKI